MGIVVSALLLTFLSRCALTYMHHRGSRLTDGDAVAHLQYVRRLWETKGASVSLKHRYLLDSNDYPTGFHRILYWLRIPTEWLERFGGFLPTIFDLCLLGVIAVAVEMWGGPHHGWLLAFPLLRMWIANVGRASHFSERAFGVLMGNLYLFFLFAYLVESNPWYLIAALAPFFVLSASSKFAWQGTLGISLAFSLLALDPRPILITVAIAMLSFITTRGASWRVLKGLIRHSMWYRSYLAPRYQGVQDRYKQLAEFMRAPSLKSGVLLLLNNSLLKIISDNPLHLLLPFLFSGDLFSWWALSGILLCVVIATPPLSFLGEPERYLEFTALPTFVLASRHPLFSWQGAVIMALLGVLYALHWYLVMRQNKDHNRKEDDLILLAKAIKTINDQTLLSIPLRTSFFMGLQNKTNRFVTLFANIGEGEMGERYERLMRDRYPFPGPNLSEIISEYQVDYLVVDEDSLSALPQNYYEFSPFREAMRAGRYTLYSTR